MDIFYFIFIFAEIIQDLLSEVNMKIAYIIETLAVVGGLEKVISEKASYLAEHFGYDVSIISCTQSERQENAFPISTKVRQINLAIPYYKQYRYKYPLRLWIKYQTHQLLRSEMQRTVDEFHPDIIIGTLKFEADLVCKLNTTAKKIIECHEARPFAMSDLEHQRSFLSHIYMQYYERRKYFKSIEKKADIVVTLTNGDKALWSTARKVEVIPNFSTMTPARHIDNQKRIIAVGRLSAEKGYDRLIAVWQQVFPKHPDWKLDIFGDGKQHDSLQELIENSDCRNITLHPSTSKINQEYGDSDIYVITSLFEGFGLTIVEAMINGLPCVAFDCPFGPHDIIDNNKNGFLVENGKIEQFAEKLCFLIEHPEVRTDFSVAAISKASSFNIDTIMDNWKSIFLSLKEIKS